MTSECKRGKKMGKLEIKRWENKAWSETRLPIERLHVNECHLFLTRCVSLCYLVFCSEEQQQAAGYCGSLWLEHNWEYSEMCNKGDFQPGLKCESSYLCTSMGCIALHNTGVFFCFQKRSTGALVFQHSPKKERVVKMKEKKAKLYFTSRLKGSLAPHIHDCSIF